MDIGIDLGTTSSVIAVKGRIEPAPEYGGAEYLPEMDVTILRSATGDLTIPSVMWWHPDDPNRYVFGDEAKHMAGLGKSPIMFSKRKIGTDEKLMLNGRAFTAKEVAERFLRYMKEWAESVTGQEVNRVVVTHPAYFSPNQREETLQAAQAAGLEITAEQLMLEPCAAVLAYAVNDTRDPLRVMIYDLGGGTFDVAVMEKTEGVIQMRKFHGDHLLGGYDFDSALVQWILDQMSASGEIIPYDPDNEEHRGRRARMLQLAEAVKIRLSEQKTDRVSVPVQVDFLSDDKGQCVQFRGQINREEYTALIQDKLQKTIDCCWAALESAGGDIRVNVGVDGKRKVDGLDAVLLVGGSTKGKWVVDAVTKEFGAINEAYFPDLCVAAGAALFASQLAPAPTGNARATLSIDYPSKSVLGFVDIAGRICPSEGSDLTPEACLRLQINLEAPDGSLVGPAEIRDGGRFIFERIALLEDGSPSSFRVRVSENGKEVLSQEGSIVYTEEPPALPCASLALSRPLFIRAEHMIAVTNEGTQLPAKCQIRLRRTFSGPKLDIPIFMENERVGTVSVEDIPEEAGEGCMVVVDVEVTQGNEMRGRVLVYGPNGETVVKEGPVHITFPPIVIPELAELLGKLNELKDQLENNIVIAPPQDRAQLAGPGRALVRKIKKITEEQAPDRQVLHEKIKELDRIVNPLADDMDPPRREFDNLLAECRETLAANAENNALKAYTSQLDRVETAGKDAYDTKNNRKWKTANETLQRIYANINRTIEGHDRTPPRTTPSATVLKAQATRMIEGLRAALKTARESREREGGAERWLEICEQYAHKIDHMASEIAKIPDNTPNDQALAQIQSYLGPSETLRKKIQAIATGAQLSAADSDLSVHLGRSVSQPSVMADREPEQQSDEVRGLLARAREAMERSRFSDVLPPLNEAGNRSRIAAERIL